MGECYWISLRRFLSFFKAFAGCLIEHEIIRVEVEAKLHFSSLTETFSRLQDIADVLENASACYWFIILNISSDKIKNERFLTPNNV